MRDQEKLFAQEWMQDHNAYKAALRAGYTNATARNAAAWIHPEHPTKPKLRDYLDRLLAQQSRRLGISADRVLNEIAKVAFVNAADVIDFETGQVKKDAKPEDLAAIAKVRVKHGEITEYCLVIAQAIPTETTIAAPVVITIGDGTVQYPLQNRCCAPVTACGIRTRMRYATVVATSPTGGVFKMLGTPACSLDYSLTAIDGTAPATAPAEGGA